MASTTFTDQTTIIVAAWLNDVDALVYGSAGNLGLDNAVIGGTTPLAGSFTTLTTSGTITSGGAVSVTGAISATTTVTGATLEATGDTAYQCEYL